MSFAANGEIRICYDTIGYPEDPPLLLIAGLGNQLVTWQDEFCASLIDRGFFVIRFDNRDCGLSSVVTDRDGYTLHDMAGDALAVLDALGVARVHLFGHSLGGMIAQVMSIEHPDRVASMTVLSTSTGNWDHGTPSDEALAAISRPVTEDREESFERDVANRRVWASPSWFDEDLIREQFRVAYDRASVPRDPASPRARRSAAHAQRAHVGDARHPRSAHRDGRRSTSCIARARCPVHGD